MIFIVNLAQECVCAPLADSDDVLECVCHMPGQPTPPGCVGGDTLQSV